MTLVVRIRSGACSPLARALSWTCRHPIQIRSYATDKPSHLNVSGKDHPTDSWTNVTATILSKVDRNLHLVPNHPLSILRQKIEAHFTSLKPVNTLSPIVSVQQNFDDLGFPLDHPGRSLTDSYYLNQGTMLRTHTSAHEVELFRQGLQRFLLTADVYRRDEIDRSHYPVFHQVEGCNILSSRDELPRLEKENEVMRQHLASSNIVIVDLTREHTLSNPKQAEHTLDEARIISEHLKNSLNSLVLSLFGGLRKGGNEEPLQVRWIEATFPWTAPSYEVEVLYDGKWLEILGCGVVKQQALDRSGVPEKLGWAFGLGLERIAMVLFSIPDIRLFWTQDERFLSQFENDRITTFKPYSKYPECYKDFSFWIPNQNEAERDHGLGIKAWHENDFCEIVRDVAGDWVEGVQLIDEFVHPKTGRRSVCYRLNYRSMDRSLSNEEVNELQTKVVEEVVREMGVEVR
ncbi:BQ2448_1477 [Microbotryum intermedium]|uniref:Phenylalanine--tRNA ligase, mitochondrial n=1 Tax=Microbotryum intermedium TaxID=269621 RepID=A0A238FDI9_9BASI|nr:BQ2448_1477 [Microbotryum intermedium]